ncbi:MAG: phenylacetate-CoA oxygenase subunit PaaJ, partial [Bacteroidetes bacterium]|nr:phenylacetate-CoA oxygenase subunit PaaJ [Bacteroidota bacterium]
MVSTGSHIEVKTVWELLNQIPDPDIPVISITELGIVRRVEVLDTGKVEITLTPSYSGCPAMSVFKDDIYKLLKENGVDFFEIKIALSPPWTTDWLTKETKDKLRSYGIAPPEEHSSDSISLFSKKTVTCPHCYQTKTELTSQFGST